MIWKRYHAAFLILCDFLATRSCTACYFTIVYTNLYSFPGTLPAATHSRLHHLRACTSYHPNQDSRETTKKGESSCICRPVTNLVYLDAYKEETHNAMKSPLKDVLMVRRSHHVFLYLRMIFFSSRSYQLCMDIDCLQPKLSQCSTRWCPKSYEHTLNYVGQDKDSGEVWIRFLQSGEVCHSSRSYSDPINRRQRLGKYKRRWMPYVKFTIALFKLH